MIETISIRQMKVFVIGLFVISTLCCCLASKPKINKSLLAGHWLTTQPETTPNIILDSSQNFLLLLEDTTTSDTLHFTYRLNGNTMTIFNSPKLWISKNDIIKLSSDSLVYQRKGDKAVFRYGKRS